MPAIYHPNGIDNPIRMFNNKDESESEPDAPVESLPSNDGSEDLIEDKKDNQFEGSTFFSSRVGNSNNNMDE